MNPFEIRYDKLLTTLENPDSIKITDGKIVNFEKILKDIEWQDWPSEEAICCHSFRTCYAWLWEEDAVWISDSKHVFVEDDGWKEAGRRKSRQFHGLVWIYHNAHCNSLRHTISLYPVSKESVYKEVIDFTEKRFGLWYCHDVELDYKRNPHKGIIRPKATGLMGDYCPTLYTPTMLREEEFCVYKSEN